MSNKIKDVYFKCPHCGKESYAYADIDPLYPVSGGAGIINDTGKLVIDWDSLDADICFNYVCSNCSVNVAGSLEELEELVRDYESKE